MAKEFMLQLAVLTLTLFILYLVHNLRKQPGRFTVRSRTRDNHQSNRRVVQGSRLLARARSNPHGPRSTAHARSALSEAEQALSLSPRDPAAHILKAQVLDFMGHRTAALRSMDSALSTPHAKSLSAAEREAALVKRAELRLAVNRRRRVDSAVEDLVEAVSLSEGTNTTAFCALGECYAWKGMREEAKEAFQRALELEPDSVRARNGLDRLGP